MKRALLILLFLATPAVSDDGEAEGGGLIERGAQMFLEGLLKEMEPAIDEMQSLGERITPAFRDFMSEMGPAMAELFENVEDWSRYHAPEILENGDIIIRRKREDVPKSGDDIEI